MTCAGRLVGNCKETSESYLELPLGSRFALVLSESALMSCKWHPFCMVNILAAADVLVLEHKYTETHRRIPIALAVYGHRAAGAIKLITAAYV